MNMQISPVNLPTGTAGLKGNEGPQPHFDVRAYPRISRRRNEIEAEDVDLEGSLEAIERTLHLFNKRIKLAVNREINRVVVKVVDAESDKVIKEIPPVEIQRLMAKIKESIGLLVDEQI